ncbi:MAG: sensor histidine kinase [Sphingomonadales bacterium]
MTSRPTLPLFSIGLFVALICLTCSLAFVGILGWTPAIILSAAMVFAAFLISFRFEQDLAQQRRDAERLTRDRERERADTFASLRSRIVQGFPSPLLMINDARRVVEANRHARDMFGADIIGNDIFFYMRQPAALDVVKQAIQSGKPENREFQLTAPVERFYTITANRIDQTDPSGSLDDPSTYYVIIALQDITKSKISDRMRVDFIANASHELRTPLSALIGFIETLSGPAADDKDAHDRFLKIMAQEADRMIRVIDDLLSLSRIELGKHVRPRDIIDLGEVLQSIEQMFQVAMDDAGRTLSIQVDGELPAVVGDRDQIIQVLQNLITNAIKYSRPKSSIRIQAEIASQDRISVKVQDQSEGIAPEHIPRLSERFYRVDTARSRQIGGTGLGLAIVKHIMERHGGELLIDSKLGIGSTMELVFPSVREDTSAALAQPTLAASNGRIAQ